MASIEIPDFDKWAEIIRNYPIKDISWNLQQVFDLGRELGQREMVCTDQEWWTEQDADKEWLDAQGEGSDIQNLLPQLDNIIKEIVIENNKDFDTSLSQVSQYLDKASGCYVARYKDTGRIIGRNCGGKPFVSIPIEE